MNSEKGHDSGWAEALRSPVVSRARKSIQTLIRRGVKANTGGLDTQELRDILGGMTTQELQTLWFFFSADLAFSRAQLVPDWKTREQAETFKAASALLTYHPTDRDSNGKYIVDRDLFETHIVSQLNTNMLLKRELRIAESRLPLLVRAHNAIGISVVFGVYLLLGFGLLYLVIPPLRRFAETFAAPFLATYLLLWALYLLLAIWRAVVRR